MPRIFKCELPTRSFSGFDSPFRLPAISCKYLDANKHHFLSRSKIYWMSGFIFDDHDTICISLMLYVHTFNSCVHGVKQKVGHCHIASEWAQQYKKSIILSWGFNRGSRERDWINSAETVWLVIILYVDQYELSLGYSKTYCYFSRRQGAILVVCSNHNSYICQIIHYTSHLHINSECSDVLLESSWVLLLGGEII